MRQFISRNRKAKTPKIDKLWFYRKTTFRKTGTKYFNAVFSINKPSRKQKYVVTHDYYLLNQPQIKGIGAHHISSTMWVNLCWLEGKKKSKIRGVNNWSVFVICFIVVGIPFLKEIQITALSPWSRIKHLLKGLFCRNFVLCNKWYFLVHDISICLEYKNFSLMVFKYIV